MRGGATADRWMMDGMAQAVLKQRNFFQKFTVT